MRGWGLATAIWPGGGGSLQPGVPPPAPRLGEPSARAEDASSRLLVPRESALAGSPNHNPPQAGPALRPAASSKLAEAQPPTDLRAPHKKGYWRHTTACPSARPGLRQPGCGGGTGTPSSSSGRLPWNRMRWAPGEDPRARGRPPGPPPAPPPGGNACAQLQISQGTCACRLPPAQGHLLKW